MKYITFKTEIEAIAANNQIYVNYFRKFVPNRESFDGDILNVELNIKVQYDQVTDYELRSEYKNETEQEFTRVYPLFGTVDNMLSTSSGFTTGWAVVRQIDENNWGIRKPQDQDLMCKIFNYTEIEIDENNIDEN